MGRVKKLRSLRGVSTTPVKPNRRILKWSASVFFIASWLVPVIPVNYSFEPLSSYISEFIRCLRAGYFFTATGYFLLLVVLACITFLLAVSLGWLVQRVMLFARPVQAKQKDDDEIAS